MPLGYKYAERSADSQINWAEVGREASGMLLEVNRVREEKKEAYNQATRDEMNNLMNTPQGQDQDANTFINNYAHDMINQMKIDEDLFKRGLLKERDYTLKRQNNVDGTKQLFEIQKLYQQKYQEKMDGVTSGKLQAMNIFNMGMVEGYGDFNNSKATINPADGTVGIGLMENKIIDGKPVRVLSKNIAPVNVIRGKILHDVPTFDVDKATTNTVANFGTRKDVLYRAATMSRAGTITELMGIDFLKTLKDPTDRKIVSDMNKAIDDQVSSFFSNPYNLSSVLTENLGKYNAQSFTFDKDVANSDASKILVKIDPNTQMTTLDPTGKNYEAQRKEAADWVRTDILRKMDQERKMSTTSQITRQDEPEWKYRQGQADKEASNTANMIGKLWYGNDNEVRSGIDYFKGIKNKDGETLFKDITRTGTGVEVVLRNGETEFLSFVNSDGTPKTQEDFIRSAGPLLAGQLDINTALQKGSYQKGRKFNKESKGRATTVTPKDTYAQYILDEIKPSFVGLSETEAVNKLKKAAAIGGFELSEAKPGFNAIEIKIPDGKGGYSGSEVFDLGESDETAQKDIYDAMVKYMVGNASESTIKANLKGGAKTDIKKRIGSY